MKKAAKSAFTLIELVLVVAILAIIASLAVSKFSDLRKQSAQKVNLSNLQSLTRAAQAYIASNRDTIGTFNRMESLIDYGSEGPWYGTQGTYDWEKNSLTVCPGIYMGPKLVTTIANAQGQTSASSASTLEEQRNQNQGITESLAEQLGIYYLSTNDVAALKAAGISNYLLHNYTAGQARNLATQNQDGTSIENGGPGFRADMSAFYRCALTNGSPVVILNPKQAQSTYKAFGCGFDLDATSGSSLSADDLFDDGYVSYRLYCFGLGRTAEFARNALDTVPRDEVYGREYYRNYILVFKQPTSAQSGGAVSFAGVLDADGNCFDDARFSLDWR